MTTGDATEWLAHAGADLHYARLGQKDSAALGNLVAFHAQQAIEKALKAVLVRHTVAFPKTHDLEQLLELIEGAGVAWPPTFNKVLEFIPFATHARYPGFDDPITKAEVDEAINHGGTGAGVGAEGSCQWNRPEDLMPRYFHFVISDQRSALD